ncbi:hypothetical protein LTR64_003823 [Lithohypha guttulata]|uniref:uncharacterized protein n=1 Tax=Lithohypha guttulata TaxID=1690604 RepID=UPI002DE02508|nr:hypothetical protein LTR51_006861 [Lithohypha guttulata]
MSIPLHSQIKPGTIVSIVLKQDQRTGRQVQGAVSQLLTRGNHPHGVKVKLVDGRVGRVQQLVNQNTSTSQVASQSNKKYYRSMADHNPWATNESQSTPWQGQGQQQQQQQQSQGTGYPQQRFYNEQQSYQPTQQQSSQPLQQQSYHPSQDYYNQASYNEQPTDNAWSDATGNPPLPQRHPQYNYQPAQSMTRNDTDDLLESQPDRAEQMEHMQAYEATAQETNEDKDRAQLEREFPDVDGSLIAALYSDTKDLSSTREMLQELGRQ